MTEGALHPLPPAPDGPSWQPTERVVLCFIVQEGRILLIEKKRGLGAGKVNGPGGRIEAGETPLQAALRETEEEVGVVPVEVRESGLLRFQFIDGYALHCIVFRAETYRGEFRETDEAKPFWSGVESIPFERMWADDVHWMGHLLSGRYFEGFFTFDQDRMLSHRVKAESLSEEKTGENVSG
jgi:8-oxo-dGTP diphosphatase